MSIVLLDTDIFSFLFKGDQAHLKGIESYLVGNTPAICFMTVAELYQWTLFNQ